MAKTVAKKSVAEEAFEKLKIYNLSLASFDRSPKGIRQYRNALTAAESVTNPLRKPLFDLYREIALDPHVSAVMTKRVVNVLDNTIKFFNDKGEEDEAVDKVMQQPFFRKLCTYALESISYGFSVIYFDNISADGGSMCRLIPRENVRPELGIVVQNYYDTTGASYLEAPNANYVIFVGEEKDLGLLCKAAPYAIYKKDDMSDWATYAQIFGMPFRWVTYDGFDPKVKRELETMLTRSLTAPWGVLPAGTTFHMEESVAKSGSSDLFSGLGDFVNKEISKLFLGNTMTLDAAGGNYKGEVHEKSELRIAASDKAFLLSLLNTEFVRILESFGIKAAGGWFAFDESEDLPMKERLELDIQLANMIDIPESYWYETYNIPRPDAADKRAKGEEKKEDKTADEDEDKVGEIVDEQKEEAKFSEGGFWKQFKKYFSDFFPNALHGRGLTEKLEEIYSRYSCSDCAESLNLSEGSKFIDEVIITAYSGDFEKAEKMIFGHTYSKLSGAVDEVFGEVKYGDSDYLLAEKLRNNTAKFSAYKTTQEIKELRQNRIDKNGELLSYGDYKNKVFVKTKAYNDRHLRTEQHSAITRSRVALQWREMSENTIYTNVRWLPSRAAHPREAHIPFYHCVWEKSDPFWATNSPGTLWGCMCGMEATDAPASRSSVGSVKGSPGLDNNPGVSGEIFTGSHPVFKGLKGSLLKDAKRLTNNNTWSSVAGEGGYVVRISKGHVKHELTANREIARRLTKIDGGDIDLLGINKTGISYDAHRRRNGELWEFKSPMGGSLKNAIQNELKGSVKERFLFALKQEHSMQEIYEALTATFIRHKRSQQIQSLEFLLHDNTLIHLDKKDWSSFASLSKALKR